MSIDVASILQQVRSGAFDERELIALHRNATAKGVRDVVKAVEEQMRGQFPRAANRLFGPADSVAREKLEEILAGIPAELDLTRNAHKNGVKTGGLQREETKHVNLYASFRTRKARGSGAYISFEQDRHDSELLIVVGRYNEAPEPETTYTMAEFELAAAHYYRLVKNAVENVDV